MKVLLKPELEKYVAEKVQAGEYADANDLINEALRVLKEQDEFSPEHEAYLQREVQRGIAQLDRGEYSEFDAEQVIAERRRSLQDRKDDR